MNKFSRTLVGPSIVFAFGAAGIHAEPIVMHPSGLTLPSIHEVLSTSYQHLENGVTLSSFTTVDRVADAAHESEPLSLVTAANGKVETFDGNSAGASRNQRQADTSDEMATSAPAMTSNSSAAPQVSASGILSPDPITNSPEPSSFMMAGSMFLASWFLMAVRKKRGE